MPTRRATPQKLWGGRFRQPTHPTLEAFSWSLPFDIQLVQQDIEGSIAHARMLGKTRIITARESTQLVRGLQALLRDKRTGAWVSAKHEDVHSLVQATLEERIGPVARKLHTARSRNDQIDRKSVV